MFKTFFSNAFMAAICSLSSVTASIFGQESRNETEFVAESVSGPSMGLVIGSSAVAGAIGGVIAAACIKKKGKEGHRGEKGSRGRIGMVGPQGSAGTPAPTPLPIAQTLIFHLTADLSVSESSTATVTYFVTDPTGLTKTNQQTIPSFTSTVTPTASIQFDTVYAGNYVAGVNVLNTNPLGGVPISVCVSSTEIPWTVDYTGTNTAALEFKTSGDGYLIESGGVGAFNSEMQDTAVFVLAPPLVP